MLAFKSVALISLMFDLQSINGVDYCNDVGRKFCTGTYTNLVCRRDNNCSPKSNCREVNMHKNLKDFILGKINNIRNKVALGQGQPQGKKAAGMMAMSWDTELAYVAQCGVNLCEEHLQKACPVSSKFRAAHIIYTNRLDVLFDDAFDYFNETIESWYSRGKEMTSLTDLDDTKYDYATLIIGHSTAMGCGWSSVVDAVNYHGYWAHYFFAACVFSQMPGKASVYEEGEPCSKCPRGAHCNSQYKALCGTIDYAPSDFEYHDGSSTKSIPLSLLLSLIVLRSILG